MTSTTGSPLLVEHEGSVLILRLNRPGKLNALNNTVISTLSTALKKYELDDAVRSVIITGAGRAFSAGTDIAEFQQHIHAGPSASVVNFVRPGQELTRQIETYLKPIIAAVNGLAYGGGCELVESIHMAVASEAARFSKSEINIGIIPTFGGTQRLVRNVGRKAAIELILTGRVFTAEEASQVGLVSHVVPEDKVLSTAIALGQSISQKPAISVSAALDVSIEDGLAIEQAAFQLIVGTPDVTEGVDAFVEKRPPKYRGSSL